MISKMNKENKITKINCTLSSPPNFSLLLNRTCVSFCFSRLLHITFSNVNSCPGNIFSRTRKQVSSLQQVVLGPMIMIFLTLSDTQGCSIRSATANPIWSFALAYFKLNVYFWVSTCFESTWCLSFSTMDGISQYALWGLIN